MLPKIGIGVADEATPWLRFIRQGAETEHCLECGLVITKRIDHTGVILKVISLPVVYFFSMPMVKVSVSIIRSIRFCSFAGYSRVMPPWEERINREGRRGPPAKGSDRL